MLAAFRIVVLLTVYGVFAGPRVLLYRNFVQSDAKSPVVVEGSQSRHAGGLWIGSNSRVRFALPDGRSVRNAATEVDFQSPTFTRDRMRILAEINHACICALKLYMGRTVLVVSERSITLGRLDKQHTGLEHTYKRVPFEFPPRAEEKTVRLEIRDNHARAIFEDSVVLESAVQAGEFNHADVQTYARGFTIAAFRLIEYVKDTLYVNAEEKYVEAAAVFTPSQFNTGSLREHHFVGWKHSPAGIHSLFQILIPPSRLDKALLGLGATPGNSLPKRSWTARHNPSRPEPELTADGSRIEISIEFSDSTYRVEDILHIKDPDAQPHSFRFGAGHLNYGTWKSGCTVCLLSCPATIIGSESYSVAEWMRDPPRHEIRTPVPFEEDDVVILRFSFKKSPAHASGTEHHTTSNKRKIILSGG